MAIKTDTFQGAGAAGAVTSVNTQTGAVVLSANDLAADHTASNYTAANSNIDGHLSGIDTKFGTLASGLTYKGTFNATAGTPSLANALKGDLYVVGTAGTIYGQTWAVGDHLLINDDMGGTITNSKIDKIDNTDQVTSVNGDTGAVTVNLQSVTDQSGVTTGTVQAGILKSPTVRVGTGATFYELPSADGSSNQVLATDGAGSLFFKNESTAAAASETVAGVIEIATNAEAAAATATDKALVPSNISSLDLSDMDNSTAGFIANINSESLNDLSDVSYTAGAGIDNYVLRYDHSTTSWGAEAETTAAAASETVAGVIEIATNAEAAAGTATDKALVPSNISSLDLSAMDNSTAGFISSVASASETVQGIIEIATNAEAAAGTATDKALVPSNISSLDLSAMDNTTSGFIANINSESLNDLSDVSYTAGAGIDNYVLTYDHSTTSWGAEAAASGGLSEIVQDLTPQLGGNLDTNGNSITSASNGNVTINPDGTGDISIGADIIPDADATHTIGDEDNRFISYYGDMNGAIRFKAKNDQGGQITKGQVVYIKGLAGDGTTPTVALADADDSAKMPAFGLAFNTANDQAEVQIVSFGNLGGLDTSGFSVGDTLFVGTTAGALVATKPTGETSLLQNIGRVIRSNNGAGVIMVGGAGRSAATPNLNQDKIFLGNASNQAVSTALSSIGLSKFNNDSGFLTNINSESLNDLSDVSYTAGAGIDNYVLKYDHSTTSWGAEAETTAAAASETVAGVIEIATNVEAAAATATDKALVPSNISSLDLSDMDNTTAGFISGITGESLNDLSDVSYTAGAGIDNYVLTYDHSTTSWGAEAAPGSTAASETVAGVIEIATNAEAAAATATDKALVPSNISSLDLSDMDNTTAGFIANINSESLNDLSDVSYTAGAGIDNYVLTYDHSTTSWGAEAAAGGGSAPSVTAQNTTATLSAPSAGTLEEVYTVNSSSAVTLTLVSAATVGEGFKYQIKRLGTGSVTVDPASTEYIDHSGQSTFAIGAQYDSITLISDGTNWLLI
ncbi:MAG: hypothetical protein NWF14_05145 [Candidatus Bathyarchaeota archaeon]|nr:hypothetical protein [Candidatus Bathyarchaeota archaeon]